MHRPFNVSPPTYSWNRPSVFEAVFSLGKYGRYSQEDAKSQVRDRGPLLNYKAIEFNYIKLNLCMESIFLFNNRHLTLHYEKQTLYSIIRHYQVQTL